jgi:hypothetical protein
LYAPNKINGYIDSGGFIGYNNAYGEIKKSYAVVDFLIRVGSSGSPGGGLVGINDGLISDCYARGVVNRSRSIDPLGGLIGRHNSSGVLINSYASVHN